MIGELKDFLDLFKEWLQALGLQDGTIQHILFILASAIILFIVGVSFYKFIGWLLFLRKRAYLKRDLHPFFTPLEINKAVRHYIPTKYQDTPPSQGDEPGRKFIDSPQSKLIPMFLKKAFQVDNNRFYLILADAGMGKTTFMVNLYLAYKRQWTWGKPKYHVRLLPLGHSQTLNEIAKIENQENTILLLDALDEDHEAVNNYKKRLSEILEKAWRFRAVVITCRTQFFPSRIEEPHETGFFKHGTEGGEFYFRKAYVSVFSNWDVIRYLLKKYNLLNPIHWIKLKKAKKIIDKSPSLMVRPMLLSHIRDLEESKQNFDYTYQIYEALIKRWIEREAQKPGIRQKYGTKTNFKEKLYTLSQNLAINIYENREKRGGLFINLHESIPASDLQLADFEADFKNLTIKESEWRSRSLLNRDVEGNYKFSHRSILEYFLAKEALDNPDFSKELRLSGLEAASNFLIDMRFEKEIWEWKKKETKMSRGEIFRSIIKSGSLGYIAWYNLGIAYYEKEDHDKAMECYQKAIALKKDYIAAWNNLGIAYYEKEDYDQAIECYQKAIALKKNYHLAWNNLGYAYYSKENYDQAIEFYQKAITLKKDYLTPWNNLGDAYQSQENYGKAIECYQQTIALEKDDHYAWHNLSFTYLIISELPKARESLEKALKYSKGKYRASVYVNFGHFHLIQNQIDEAYVHYKKGVKLLTTNKQKNDFFKKLNKDYKSLNLKKRNIKKEDYDKIVEELKTEAQIEVK